MQSIVLIKYLRSNSSAMDKRTENFTLGILNKIKPHIAILYISHRLNTLKDLADNIYVLENQTTFVSGSHYELLQTSNFYSDYWKSLN